MNNCRNYINGERLESASDKIIQNINPANARDVIGAVKLPTCEEARRTVEVAYDAFRQWKSVTRAGSRTHCDAGGTSFGRQGTANDCDYGLSSSIFTADAARIFRLAQEIETGMTHINSPTTGGEAHIPFGGIKAAGIGEREQGSTFLDFYTELKVVYVDYTGRKREGNLY